MEELPLSKEVTQSVFVIGHKNPDTDSICSAIGYSNLKCKVTGESYVPRRAGNVSSETQFVLDRFGLDAPILLNDARTQVKDLKYKCFQAVTAGISLKDAWDLMDNGGCSTLAVVDEDDYLEGIITISDIAKSCMDLFDNEILAKSKTSYKNLLSVLNGKMVVGDESKIITEGKVLVAAANPDRLQEYVETGDVIILGNRFEAQECAIEKGAKCLIICTGVEVSEEISQLAEKKGCAIIKTEYDSYTATRLVNQSMPVEYFMNQKNLVTFTEENFTDDVKKTVTETRHHNFPVLNQAGKYIGMLSRRELLDINKKKLILVDHNETSQAVDGMSAATLLEVIDHHKLGDIQTMEPIYFRNQPVGCTATIVYQMFQETNTEIEPAIAGVLCSAILSDTLAFRSPTCTPVDRKAANALASIAGIPSIEEYAKEMFAAGSNLLEKKPKEIFYQDFKKFTAGSTVFGVGQITSMDGGELKQLKDRMLTYMEETFKDHGVDMLFFMLTDILEESSELLYYGEGAKEAVEQAFVSEEADRTYLKGVVSRKKQIIPQLMGVL